MTLYQSLAIVALLAIGDWLAIWRDRAQLRHFFKPATLLALIIWTTVHLPTGPGPQWWFVAALAMGLLGDIFLLNKDSYFIHGLAAFLLGHIAYIIGFSPWPLALFYIGAWGLLALIIAAVAYQADQLFQVSLTRQGKHKLALPVRLYTIILSLALFSALYSFIDPAWTTQAAYAVGLGMFLFFLSDLILAWNRFVAPLSFGRYSIILYHLGQIGIALGVVWHFSFVPW